MFTPIFALIFSFILPFVATDYIDRATCFEMAVHLLEWHTGDDGKNCDIAVTADPNNRKCDCEFCRVFPKIIFQFSVPEDDRAGHQLCYSRYTNNTSVEGRHRVDHMSAS